MIIIIIINNNTNLIILWTRQFGRLLLQWYNIIYSYNFFFSLFKIYNLGIISICGKGRKYIYILHIKISKNRELT